MSYIEENARIWDKRAENNDKWSIPVSAEEVKRAMEGSWDIVLTPTKPVPTHWLPKQLNGLQIPCLASGGGQQGPILAAAGADVTVFDNSKNAAAKRYAGYCGELFPGRAILRTSVFRQKFSAAAPLAYRDPLPDYVRRRSRKRERPKRTSHASGFLCGRKLPP